MKSLMILCIGLISADAFSWGAIGHRVVGGVAQNHLKKRVNHKIKKIMHGKSLADAGTWADEKRSNPNYKELSKSHYTSIHDHDEYEQERDNDIVAMINDLIASLKGEGNLIHYENKVLNNLSEKDKISLLVHFVGDLHQPLHVGRFSDRGGNGIRVNWFYKDSNLHRVWDSGIIQKMELSYSEIIEFIDYPENIDKSWYKKMSAEEAIIASRSAIGSYFK